MATADVPLVILAVLVAANVVVYGRSKVVWLVLAALVLIGSGVAAILLALMSSTGD